VTKKDPPSPLDMISELLVSALTQMRAKGVNVDKAGADMKALIAKIEEKAHDPAVRAEATHEVQKLVDLVTTFGRALGGAIAHQEAPIGKAVREANTEQVTDGLRKLLEYLKTPPDDTKLN
jgi:hypothetical protein